MATEKKAPSSLVDDSSWEQIAVYTDSTGLVFSGMGPDFRVLVRQGQKKAAAYALQYGVRGAAAPHVGVRPTAGPPRA